jgi:hypothetical protein
MGSILDILTYFTNSQEASDFLVVCWWNEFAYTSLPPEKRLFLSYNLTIANGSALSSQALIDGLPLIASLGLVQLQIEAVMGSRDLIIGFSYFTVIFGK